MGILDAPIGAMAQRLISIFGRTITVRVYSRGSYDAASGGYPSPGLSSEYSVKVVIEEYPESDTRGGEEAKDSTVRAGDRKVSIAKQALAAVGAPAPDTTWELVMENVPWRIVKLDGVSSGDQDAMYVLHARR